MTLKEVVKFIKARAEELEMHPGLITLKDLGPELSKDKLRKYGGISLIQKANFPIEGKSLGEIHTMKSNANYVSKLENTLGQSEITEDKIKDILKNIKAVNVKAYKPKKKVKVERALNLILSDLHFGSDLLRSETGSCDYGKIEEARRFAKVIKETCDYKLEHRDATKLNVLLLGDIIQGDLGHDPRDGAPLAEQICRAIHLLSQGITQLSASFPSITLHVNSGNHDRRPSRHHGRATKQKWDSYQTVIAYALKVACKNLSNVHFNIPKTPFVTYEVFGHKIFASHGDTVLNPGNPGKVIKTGFLENQINRINSSLKDADEYSVFCVGHLHQGTMSHLGNNTTLITNGALTPIDDFAVSIGLLESTSGQWLWESVKGYPVGDSRYIKVGLKEDTDKTLDVIIKPFEGL